MSKRSDIAAVSSADLCSDQSHGGLALEGVRSSRASRGLLERTAVLFSAMGDPTRLRLLEALSIRELCVCDLAELSGVSQSAVSHQLRLLRELGLVAFTREANRVIYRLADDHVAVLLRQGFDHAEEGTP
jgi:DNA-binding transcriptional ArsR family regulator